jgi:Flp pilus assembly protein TadD
MTAHYAFTRVRRPRAHSLLAVTTAALLAGACSSTSDQSNSLESLLGPSQSASAPNAAGGPSPGDAPRSELEKAIGYWGEEHKKKPQDAKVALSFARNLKAAGQKEQAFAVLQSVALVNGDNKELASEMGRLALELNQVPVAEKLLAMADNPAKPDWRLISARGTALAKQNKYAEAIPFFERALILSPSQASVMSNLAMAHAANGEPGKAEELLRKATSSSNDPKIKQNLALVLGLQGKHDEAGKVRSAGGPSAAAESDTEYVKQMVRATPATNPAPAPAVNAAPAPQRPAPQAKAIEAKNTARAAPAQNGMRATGGPSDVASPAGAWSTSVSAAR